MSELMVEPAYGDGRAFLKAGQLPRPDPTKCMTFGGSVVEFVSFSGVALEVSQFR